MLGTGAVTPHEGPGGQGARGQGRRRPGPAAGAFGIGAAPAAL